MALFDIPEHWSDEQAMAIYELLAQLQERIWDYYQAPLVEIFQREMNYDLCDLHNEPGDLDDDIPF